MPIVPDDLIAIGFAQEARDFTFTSISNYLIKVKSDSSDFSKSKIDYGDKIICHNKSTSNFSQSETLVVLECVIRLLNLGYPPESIELEKTWKLGRKEKGRLDILLKNSDNKTFSMIECKTWGEEYIKEKENTVEDGGQIFSYFIQDRSAEQLYIYSSKIDADEIKYIAEYIDTSILIGNNKDEILRSWDKSFINDGIFSSDGELYNNVPKPLYFQSLRILDRESGRGLFNSFASILRRHTVSDKSNAFNKIFNLFVCKIVDEDSGLSEDAVNFQWFLGDDYSSLISRLSELYQSGVKNYLDIEVDKRYFSDLNEFSFIDVFDEESFERNGKILKETVQLMQNYKIKYSARHQFLGDFFENLLNSGVKQESGQYFTVPTRWS